MTITVNILTPLGSDPDWYTLLGFIDGAGSDQDPVLNDTSTLFNAEVSLFNSVIATAGAGFTYDKFGRAFGTGTVTSSTIIEAGVSVAKITHSTPVKLLDIINGVTLFATGRDPTQGNALVGQPYTFYPDGHTTYLLDNIYMKDNYVYTGNAGDDTFTTGFLADKLDGKAGNDELHGNNGDDTLIGGLGNDTLFGDNGSDVLDGGAGNDVLIGGNNDVFGDTATYASVATTDAVTIDLGAGTATGSAAIGTDALVGIESVIGTKNNDTIVGSSSNTYFEFIEGGAGNDSLSGSGHGGGGMDFLSYYHAAAAVTVSLLTNSVAGGGGVDQISSFNNLVGSAFNDKLTGDANDNWVEGYLGNDTMIGGGNGGGGDWAVYALTQTGVTVDLAIQNGTTAQNTRGAGLDVLSGFENLLGSFSNDKLSGDGGNNFFVGLDGNDVLTGRGGHDTLDGGNGRNTASYAGSAAVNVDLTLAGAQAAQASDADGDVLTGIQDLIGSDGADTLIGSDQNNAITGGLGADVMTGNAGVDFFRFTSVLESNGDTITDFAQGIDKIDLALIDAKTGVLGNQRFKFLGNDVGLHGIRGELTFNTGTGSLLGDVNGDAVADFTITLNGIASVSVADIIL